jgi:3-hydroxybutyryl-CoA dehydrogenase
MTTIGVAGAGAMGTGIAQMAAQHGHPVVLYDAFPEALERASDQLQAILNRLAAKGKISNEDAVAAFGRIHFSGKTAALADAGVVIEAVIEDLDVKQKLFEEIERVVDEKAILATNTSSLPVTRIAAGLKDPGRCAGMHFFNPAPVMKLVEIIPAAQTRPEVSRALYELGESWGKTAVYAKDTPGFIVNRVARPFYGEALRIYDEGIADSATIDAAITELGGFRMGPFTLMDYIGHDVNFAVTESVYNAYYQEPRYKPSFSQKALVDAGYLGRKTGRGFYEYGEGAEQPEATGDDKLKRQVFDRILTMLINEAAEAVFWGISSPKDIDLAMTRGVNYPKGLLAWADELGIETCVTRLDALYDMYREDRYRCSPLLRRMGREGNRFFK